ncbi:DUF6303 family protein [Streptomyces sp. NBC_00378]|uniref:DUF6303 family protein n=1 Tax=Streptomyces sp. NBC_00378 TaxID=2975732 RepID=UPI00225BCB54|nr:DUF6303 family protein [Streptomyces sp. NBC_00378]MCX5110671.1 DUF6303 family protein [Streptomyces sp. NBC_00378]
MMEHTAQISNRGGRWRLYVVLLGGLVSQWPEHDFGPVVTVPTVAERSRALAALGFVFIDGAEWEWTEDNETHGDDTSPVLLLASIRVRSRDGGVS